MHCFLEKRKLNDSLWILLKCTNVWHVEDSARFLLRATGWEVLLWLLRSLEISSSCWKGSDFFFFWSFMGKFYIFERGQISRVGSETSCLWSLPPHWSKASRCSVYLSAWSVGQSPAWEGGKVSQSLTLDTIPVVVPCPEAAEGPPLMGSVSVRFPSVCCRAPDTSLVCLPCATEKAVEQLQLYLPALDLNSEVKDFLYLITIPLSHLNALDFLF